jgi:hypothetical protein
MSEARKLAAILVADVVGYSRLGVAGAGWWAVANHLPRLQSHPDREPDRTKVAFFSYFNGLR